MVKFTLDHAKSLVIPEGIGVPLAGKDLGTAMEDPMFGRAGGQPILKFLSGKFANASGKFFTPANEQQQQLQAAADALLAAEPVASNGKKNGK